MADTTYRSGQWFGIVRSGAVIVLEAGTDPATVDALWECLGNDTPSIHGVLNAVTSHFGTDLTGMPQFGILVAGDRLHVILRGGMSLAVETGGTADAVSGRDVTTWSERSLALPDSLVLALDGDMPAGAELPLLPVGESVVLLSELRCGAPSVADTAGGRRAAEADAGAVVGTGAVPLDMDDAGPSPAPASPLLGGPLGDAGGSPVVAFDAAGGPEGGAAAASHGGTGDRGDTSVGDADLGDADLGGTDLGRTEAVNVGVLDQGAGADGHEAGTGVEADEAEPGAEADEAEPGAEADEAGTGVETADGELEEDAYAGFAMAADAEWNAELDEPSRSEQDAINLEGHGSGHDLGHDTGHVLGHELGEDEGFGAAAGAGEGEGFGAAAGAGHEDSHDDGRDAALQPSALPLGQGPDWGTDEDLGEAMYPSMDHDDAPAAAALSDAVDSSDAGDAGGAAAGSADAEQADVSNATNGGHLFGATELHSAEDEAVRFDENGQEIEEHVEGPAAANIPPQPQLPPSAGQLPVKPSDVPGEDRGAGGAQAGATATWETPRETAGEAPGEAPAPAWQPPSGFQIDSVPWGNSNSVGGGAALQGDAAGAVDTDRDGRTVMRGEVAGDETADGVAAGSGGAPATAPLESRPPTGPVVLARLCPSGHANPPSRSQCSECGAAIDSEAREVGRPRLGRMHISTGELIDLDHSLVIGRQPFVSRVMGGEMPRLVQVQSASGDISRSHVEVRLDGWDVLLVDLRATNGTVLVREGQAPRRLGQGEQAILLNGDVAELGDGVSLLFEGLL